VLTIDLRLRAPLALGCAEKLGFSGRFQRSKLRLSRDQLLSLSDGKASLSAHPGGKPRCISDCELSRQWNADCFENGARRYAALQAGTLALQSVGMRVLRLLGIGTAVGLGHVPSLKGAQDESVFSCVPFRDGKIRDTASSGFSRRYCLCPFQGHPKNSIA